MSRARPRIRNQLANSVALGEQLRDTQQGIDTIPLMVQRRIDMAYSEPLVLGNLLRSPDSIEVVRVLDLSAQETPVPAGGLCHFTWNPKKGGAQIMSIDGMSVAANGGKKYRFTFRLSYAPAGGSNG